MGEETTWFDLLPGVKNLTITLSHYLGRTAGVDQFPTDFRLTHVLSSLFVLLIVVVGSITFYGAMRRGGDAAIVPPNNYGLRNLVEMFAEGVFGFMEQVLGPKDARRFFPLIGTLAFFIFLSNCMALFPGFAPPTATLKTNLVLGGLVFVMTHYYGVRENGFAYLKHFLGPVIWLAPMFILIEIVSHIARPVSLSLRLLGNIAADHKVVAAFFALVPILVPVPFLVLGTLVCIVQTLVFCILTMVYIQGAVAHEHDDEHAAHESH